MFMTEKGKSHSCQTAEDLYLNAALFQLLSYLLSGYFRVSRNSDATGLLCESGYFRSMSTLTPNCDGQKHSLVKPCSNEKHPSFTASKLLKQRSCSVASLSV